MKRMDLAGRLLIALGAGILAASFFLPPESDRRAFVLASNFAQPLRDAETAWEFCFGAGAVILLSMPYAWAAIAALGALAGRRAERGFTWVMNLLQTGGLLVVSALAISLIVKEDTWMSPKAMWSLALVPLALIAGLWLVFFLSSIARRFYALVLFLMIPYAAMNLGIAKWVVKYEGDPSGFLAGGVAALIAAAAAIFIMVTRKPDVAQATRSESAVPPAPAG